MMKPAPAHHPRRRRRLTTTAVAALATLATLATPAAANVGQPETPPPEPHAQVGSFHPDDTGIAPPESPDPVILTQVNEPTVSIASVDPLGIDKYPALHQALTTGEDRVAVWVCTVPNNTTEGFYSQFDGRRVARTPASVASWANQNVSPWFREVSGGRFTTTFTAAGTIALTATDGPNACYQKAIERTGPPFSNTLAVDTTTYGGGFAGPGYIEFSNNGNIVGSSTLGQSPRESARGMWVGGGATNGANGVVIHELGHTLHWPHSHAGGNEYGNNADVMSRVTGNAQHTLAVNRYFAGWIDPSQVRVFAGNTINADLNRPGVPGTQLIAVKSPNPDVFTTIEARPRTGRDGGLPRGGVAVHTVDQRPCAPYTEWDLQLCPGLGRNQTAVNASNFGNEHIITPGNRLTVNGVIIEVTASTTDGYRVRVAPAVPRFVDPFNDVLVSDYYADAVRWMVGNNITRGYPNDTRFSPAVNVTRCQLALFLHRQAGSPNPSVANRFADVSPTAAYTTAVRWLDQNGITTGVGGGDRFAPNAPVSRSEMALMLHRLSRTPAAASAHRFTDVTTTGQLGQAVSWMAERGITTGRGNTGTFDPSGAVSRGQISAFLYRLNT